MLIWIAGAILALIFVLTFRVLFIYREMQRVRCQGGNFQSNDSPRKEPCRTLVVLGSGGHTSEMLHMIRQLDASNYHPMIFVVASTDHTSLERLKATMPSNFQKSNNQIYTIPRSREVGQSYLTSLFTTIYALFHAMGLVIRIRPQLLLCNGPGTCVPLVLAAWMIRILGFPCKLVFCESYCRVQTLSLTGKILYHGVDLFLVHWDELHRKYPKSYRISTFVKPTPRKAQ